MKLPRHLSIGIGITAALAVVVGVLVVMNLSSPRRRTVVVQPKPPSMDEAAARKEVDRRIADIRARGEPILVTDFKPKPLDPKGNAAEPLIAAMKWLDTKEHNDNEVWQIELSPRMNEAQWRQVDEALKTFAPALALVDEADGRTGVDWNIEFKSPAIGILLPRLNGARHVANLLRMSALSEHRAGRHDEAVRRITQMVTLARHVDRGHPAAVGHLVACGISALAVQTVGDVAPTLQIASASAASVSAASGPASSPGDGAAAASPEQVSALIQLLLDPRTLHAGLRDAAIAERMFVLDTVQSLIDGRLTMKELDGMTSGRQSANEPEPQPPSRADLTADLAELLDFTTVLVAASSPQRLPEFRKQLPPVPVTRTPLGQMLTAYDAVGRTHYQTVTRVNLAAAALAVRAWSLDHGGAMPASLDDLVPKYLPAPPPDPLLDAPAALLFRASPSPMVYSTGVNDRGRWRVTTTRSSTGKPDFFISLVDNSR